MPTQSYPDGIFRFASTKVLYILNQKIKMNLGVSLAVLAQHGDEGYGFTLRRLAQTVERATRLRVQLRPADFVSPTNRTSAIASARDRTRRSHG